MKTIFELRKKTKKTNLTFNEINPTTTDFEGYSFLKEAYCTLLCKKSDRIFYISFDCNDDASIMKLYNGMYRIIVDGEYIYDVEQIKSNRIIEF